MPRKVKNRTTVSAKHQVTIPAAAFKGAGLRVGDVLEVEASGPGRVVMSRSDEILARFSGCMDTGASLRKTIEELRDEWR
jgi:bifunctional DNA-binding transcriptional regulator/antitoxin component of YhaV-PrlF toxin-antitoxin module